MSSDTATTCIIITIVREGRKLKHYIATKMIYDLY